MPQRKSQRPAAGSSRGPRSRAAPDDREGGERLQKILAAAGVASRRDCEQLILEGRVVVDGQVVTRLGSKADPATQEIVVDGQKLKQPKHVYYAVYKPPGVVSTSRDPSGRMRLVDLAPDEKRLFCVGRLDRSSEGLALLTNDGDLAHRIMHPRFGVAKTYVVEVAGKFTPSDVQQLQDGVYLSEGKAKASSVRIKSKKSKSTVLEIELREGKNREIRRIMAKLDHKVLNLRRTAIGPLRLGEMPEGSYRELTPQEIAALRRDSAEGGKKSPAPRKPKRSAPPEASRRPTSTPQVANHDFDADDFDEGDEGSDELIEIRDATPLPGVRPGAVIGGEKAPRAKRPPRAETSRGAPRKRGKAAGKGKPRGAASAKGRPVGKGAKKGAGRGKPKRKGGR